MKNLSLEGITESVKDLTKKSSNYLEHLEQKRKRGLGGDILMVFVLFGSMFLFILAFGLTATSTIYNNIKGS